MQETLVLGIDGCRVRAFASSWNSHKPPIVVVLPFGAKVRIADAFLAELAGYFNVVTWESRMIVDDPGTPADLENLTPRMHAADMIRVMSRFDIQRADVVGYCSGAGIALLAARGFPNRVARIALVSGEYVLPPSVCDRTRYQQEVDSLLPIAAASRENAALISYRLTQKGESSADSVVKAATLPFLHQESLHRFGVNYLSYRQIDFLEVASAVEHRALVIVGGRDEQVSVESSRRIHRNLRNGELHVDPFADHYDVCRGGKSIGRSVLEFLQPQRTRSGLGEARHS